MKLEGNHQIEAFCERVYLSLVDPEVTNVKYAGDVQLGGTITSVGQRMVQGTAKMVAQFFTCLGAEAKTEVGEPPPQHGFPNSAEVVLRVAQTLPKSHKNYGVNSPGAS